MKEIFETFKPQHLLIKKYVDYYYLDIKPDNSINEFQCFPHFNNTISFYRSHIRSQNGEIIFSNTDLALQIFTPIRQIVLNVVQRDRKGNLTCLEVEKTSKTIHDFNKIKEYLSKNAKKITVDDNDSNAFYWEDKPFYYFLSKREGEEEVSYDSQGSRKAKSINVIEINLAMFEKSYIKEMESLQIYSPGNQFWKKQ